MTAVHAAGPGGVTALAPDAKLHERDAGRERGALDGVAMTLLQYTPEVAMVDAASLVLDVSASLSAFGGRLAPQQPGGA